MDKIKETSLLGSAPSSFRKAETFLRLSDLKTDTNIKKSSFLNAELDGREEDLLQEEAKISSVSLIGSEEGGQQQIDPATFYTQGFADALTSFTKEMKSSKEDEETSPGGPGAGVAAAAGGVLAGGALGAGGFAALSGTTGASQGSRPTSVPYSPFKGTTGRPVISSGYGTRGGRMHRGYDVEADPGTPVYAYFPGIIIEKDYDANGWGHYIKWKDNVYGQTHLYGHLQTASPLAKNQKFDQGTVLGYVGSTGRSTGPHLHWEIGNGNANPAEWVRAHPMKTKDSEAAKIKPEAKPKSGDLKPSVASSTTTRTLIQPVIAQTPSMSSPQSGQLNRQGGSNTSNFTTMASNLSAIG